MLSFNPSRVALTSKRTPLNQLVSVSSPPQNAVWFESSTHLMSAWDTSRPSAQRTSLRGFRKTVLILQEQAPVWPAHNQCGGKVDETVRYLVSSPSVMSRTPSRICQTKRSRYVKHITMSFRNKKYFLSP